MTEAYIPPKNETNCYEQFVKANKNINETTVGNCKDQICGCYNKVDIEAQKNLVVKEQLIQNNSSLLNNTYPATTIRDCAEKLNDTSNCVETQIKSNQIRDNDTVLKYVYKKDEKVNNPDKFKGHAKNSVRRRKRALYKYNSNEDVRYAESVPLIVNYKTSHPPQKEKQFERIRDVIKNSELADFNIETLHEIIQPNKNSEDIKDKSKKPYFNPIALQRPHDESVEIINRDEYREHKKNSKPYKENHESDERSGYRKKERGPQSERDSKPYKESNESGEKGDYRENKRESLHDRNGKPYRNSEDSGERSDYRENKRQPFHDRNAKPHRDIEDSGERGNYRHNVKGSQHDQNSKPYRDSNESGERSDYRESDEEPPRNQNKKPHRESEESGERSDSREITIDPSLNRGTASDENSRHKASYSAPRTDSSESRESEHSDESSYLQGNKKESYANPPRDSSESRENKQSEESSNPRHTNSKESQETNEAYYRSPDKLPYKETRDRGAESKENEDKKPSYRKEASAGTDSTENRYYKNSDNVNVPQLPNNNNDSEEEEIIAIMKKKNRKPINKHGEEYKSELKDQTNTISPIKIRDVDLDNFSYERIHVNDKGIVEPAKDTHENYETDSQVEIAPTATQIPQTELIVGGNQYSESIESIGTPSGGSHAPLYDAHIQPNSEEIHEGSRAGSIINKVNKGEVRPVVEITNDSGELNDENSNEALKSNPGNDDTSLETLLGVKLPDGNEQSDKIDLQQNTREKGDVKQQFERIPLNYNHNKKKENQNDDNSNSKSAETSKVDNDNVSPNQGTLDVLTPNDDNFDEHLNIKFDDLAIKLPEINLPKDILAYTYEEPTNEKQTENHKAKPHFYRYSDEYNSEEKPHGRKNKHHYNDDDDDHYDYGGYFEKNKKKDNYKKKQQEEEDEDEEVDLYEKFVRERFGKRGSFEKRSQKLTDSRPIQTNPQLYKTLRQVLKKTEDIEKQAEKSGDPNAGYMWTLEYGQPL